MSAKIRFVACHKLKCVFAACTASQHARGLCHEHYGNALSLVIRGKTTWEALELAGLALPPRSRHLQLPRRKRLRFSKFSQALKLLRTAAVAQPGPATALPAEQPPAAQRPPRRARSRLEQGLALLRTAGAVGLHVAAKGDVLVVDSPAAERAAAAKLHRDKENVMSALAATQAVDADMNKKTPVAKPVPQVFESAPEPVVLPPEPTSVPAHKCNAARTAEHAREESSPYIMIMDAHALKPCDHSGGFYVRMYFHKEHLAEAVLAASKVAEKLGFNGKGNVSIGNPLDQTGDYQELSCWFHDVGGNWYGSTAYGRAVFEQAKTAPDCIYYRWEEDPRRQPQQR